MFFSSSCEASVQPQPEKIKFNVKTELPGEVVVELISKDDPIIHAEIPGHGKGRFLVDSAAQVTFLDEGFAKRSSLPIHEYSIKATVSRGGKPLRTIERYTKVERLSIGAAVARDLTPPVLDFSHIQAKIDGIIGQDILHNWTVLFDAPRDQIRILPAGDLVKALERLVAPGTALHGCPVKWRNKIPYMEFDDEDGGLSFEMVIDTGATGCSLPKTAIASQKLERHGTNITGQINGSREHATYRLGVLDLGGWRVPDLLVGESDFEHGILGYNVLKNFVFIIDGPGEAVHLMHKPKWK